MRPRRTLALPPADVKPARDGEFGSATGCLGGRDGAGLTWAVGVMPEGGAEFVGIFYNMKAVLSANRSDMNAWG